VAADRRLFARRLSKSIEARFDKSAEVFEDVGQSLWLAFSADGSKHGKPELTLDEIVVELLGIHESSELPAVDSYFLTPVV